MIEIFSFINSYSTWVLDTRYGSHICVNMQMIRNYRKLEKDEMILHMGSEAKVATLGIGSCSLSLPTGLVIKLSNCYYVSSIRKNIISISCLVMDGFNFEIENKGISIICSLVSLKCSIKFIY